MDTRRPGGSGAAPPLGTAAGGDVLKRAATRCMTSRCDATARGNDEVR